MDADAQEYKQQQSSGKSNKELQKLPPHLRQQYKQYHDQQKPQVQGTRPVSHPSRKAGETYSQWRQRMIGLYKNKQRRKEQRKKNRFNSRH